MIKTRTWIILFAVLLAAAAALYFWGGSRNAHAVTARVIQDGAVIKEIALEEVKEAYSFTVTDPAGHFNIISVEPGRICIAEADCPDKLCVHQGWLSSGITPIVCLPHKLMIQLTEGDP